MPHPLSLYLVVSSESGWKKSQAEGNAFQAHTQADDHAEQVWAEARKEAARKKNDDSPKVSDTSPITIRDNVTIAALLRVLSRGRRTQGLVQTEAATLFNGHSFTTGRVDSMAELSKLWDGKASSIIRVRDAGVEFRLSGQQLTMLLLGQPGVVDRVVFSEDAANGFGPRLLYSADTQRPDRLTFDWPDGGSADAALKWFTNTIYQIRRGQDHGREYLDYEPQARTIIAPTAAARGLLERFYLESEKPSDNAESPHERAYWIRAPEQAARIAATLAGWGRLQKLVTNPEYDLAETAPAIELARWYGEIIRLRALNAMIEQDTAAAQSASKQLPGFTPETYPKLFNKGLLAARTFLQKYSSGKAYYLRGDAEARERVLWMLVAHGWLVDTKLRGLFMKNPHIGQAD